MYKLGFVSFLKNIRIKLEQEKKIVSSFFFKFCFTFSIFSKVGVGYYGMVVANEYIYINFSLRKLISKLKISCFLLY